VPSLPASQPPGPQASAVPSPQSSALSPKPYVTLIDPEQDSRWDLFVEEHPHGWITHLSGWKKVLERTFSHMRGYYFATVDETSEDIIAGLPVFEVKSWVTGRRLVSIPFATLSDPLIAASGNLNHLLGSVFELFSRLKSGHLEIRTFQSNSLVSESQFGVVGHYLHHYLPLGTPPEKLMKGFHRTCVRQRIARAQKSNLKLIIGEDESDLRRFYRLHSMTRRRQGLPLHPYALFRAVWEEFQPSGRVRLLIAEKDGVEIAGLILFRYRKRVSAEYAAFDEKYRDLSPNHYLFWQAIKSAYEEGHEVFDFGRTSPSNASLMEFKSRWGTKVMELPQFYYPKEVSFRLSQRENSWKYRAVRKLCTSGPDRFQKTMGDFCYKHLG